MIIYAEITNFMFWFWSSTVQILNWIVNTLQGIEFSGVTLFNFIVAIFLATIFIGIIFAETKTTGNKIANNIERKRK